MTEKGDDVLEAPIADLAPELVLVAPVGRVLSANEHNAQRTPHLPQLVRDREELAVAFDRVEPADKHDRLADRRADRVLEQSPAFGAVMLPREDSVVDDLELARVARTECLEHRCADADHTLAAAGNETGEWAVPGEIVLDPDDRHARGSEGGDQSSLDAIRVHDGGTGRPQPSRETQRGGENGGRPRGGGDDGRRHAPRPQLVGKRPLLETDDIADPAALEPAK